MILSILNLFCLIVHNNISENLLGKYYFSFQFQIFKIAVKYYSI